jgi:hypothetical protein
LRPPSPPFCYSGPPGASPASANIRNWVDHDQEGLSYLPYGTAKPHGVQARRDYARSDRQIAKIIGVSDKTVAAVRKGGENAEFPQIPHSPAARVEAAARAWRRAVVDGRVQQGAGRRGKSPQSAGIVSDPRRRFSELYGCLGSCGRTHRGRTSQWVDASYSGSRIKIDARGRLSGWGTGGLNGQIAWRILARQNPEKPPMRDPRTMLLDIDHSGLHSEPGSREWIITRRSLLVACLSDIKNNRSTGQAVFAEIQQRGGWEHLRDLKGRPFRSFTEFCRSPNGLNLEREEIERRLTAPELAQAEADGGVTAARDPKGGRPTAEEVKRRNQDNIRVTLYGTSAAAIVARLKRDAPEFAERLAAGEFRSARAAARAAGFNVDTPPLTLLRRAWRHASDAERETFLAEIGQ